MPGDESSEAKCENCGRTLVPEMHRAVSFTEDQLVEGYLVCPAGCTMPQNEE